MGRKGDPTAPPPRVDEETAAAPAAVADADAAATALGKLSVGDEAGNEGAPRQVDEQEDEGDKTEAAEQDVKSADSDEEEDDEDDDGDDEDEDDEEAAAEQEALRRVLLALAGPAPAPQPPHQLLPSLDLAGVAAYLASDRCRRVVFLVGAGASTSAGIPDFRTPGTGLYDNLASLGLPHPEAVFDLDFFREDPRPFYALARSLYPGAGAAHRPTPAHHFFELVRRKGKLGRVFTQNIDALEHVAGLGEEHVVAAHGNFGRCHCIDCGAEYDKVLVERALFGPNGRRRRAGNGDGGRGEETAANKAERQQEEEEGGAAKDGGGDPPNHPSPPRCPDARCGGLVKPSIVFYGEGLPARFFQRRRADLPRADLLVVVGTSLVVHPFAGLVHDVAPHVPRLLINRERVGEARRGGGGGRGFVFDASAPGGGRDVLFLGDADEGCRELARLCGWGEELEALVAAAAGEEEPGDDDDEEAEAAEA